MIMHRLYLRNHRVAYQTGDVGTLARNSGLVYFHAVNDHYNPQFYLRAWRDPAISTTKNRSFVWVADLLKREISSKRTQEIAFREDYYAARTEKGDAYRGVDDLLKIGETAVEPVIAKLRRRDFVLSGKDIGALAQFMGFLYMRVPRQRETVENVATGFFNKLALTGASTSEGFRTLMRQVERKRGIRIEGDIEEARQDIILGNIKMKALQVVSLAPILSVGWEITQQIARMHWTFLQAPTGVQFLTSDNPVFWIDPTSTPQPYGANGLLMENVILFFPICPFLCLLATWQRLSAVATLESQDVAMVNEQVVTWAHKAVFSSTQGGAQHALDLTASMR